MKWYNTTLFPYKTLPISMLFLLIVSLGGEGTSNLRNLDVCEE